MYYTQPKDGEFLVYKDFKYKAEKFPPYHFTKLLLGVFLTEEAADEYVAAHRKAVEKYGEQMK